MTWIIAAIFVPLIGFILVKRKGWKTALIMVGILTAILVITSGAIGLLF